MTSELEPIDKNGWINYPLSMSVTFEDEGLDCINEVIPFSLDDVKDAMYFQFETIAEAVIQKVAAGMDITWKDGGISSDGEARVPRFTFTRNLPVIEQAARSFYSQYGGRTLHEEVEEDITGNEVYI
jgi:hypothetical protein